MVLILWNDGFQYFKFWGCLWFHSSILWNDYLLYLKFWGCLCCVLFESEQILIWWWFVSFQNVSCWKMLNKDLGFRCYHVAAQVWWQELASCFTEDCLNRSLQVPSSDVSFYKYAREHVAFDCPCFHPGKRWSHSIVVVVLLCRNVGLAYCEALFYCLDWRSVWWREFSLPQDWCNRSCLVLRSIVSFSKLHAC